MTELEAVEALRDADLIPAVQGSLLEVRDVQRKCLNAGIPALAARPEDNCASKSCGTKLQLMMRKDDLPQLQQLMSREWAALLEREGTGAALMPGGPLGEDDELPCPACGTAAPLDNGACSDCGLHLG